MNENNGKHVFENDRISLRTRLSYGLGCIGRDAVYTLVSSFLITYLTLAVGLSTGQLAAVGVIMVVARVWDAINDPMMGTIIDNTRSRWGKFKPYIIAGALLNCVFTVLLFSGSLGSQNKTLFLVLFAITYILWGMTYTMNDIAYWGMLPSLTVNPGEREKLTSTARIGASVGLFAVTALVPMLSAGNMNEFYRVFSIIAAALFLACQVLVILGVQEKKNSITQAKSGARLKEIFKIIGKNDQLLAVAIALLLFNIAYYITTGMGIYFFWFDYGNYGGMEYTIFALTIGVTQIIVLALFPRLSRIYSRKKLFTGALLLVVIGYIGFMLTKYVLPLTMPVLIVIGFILFSGQAVIQMLQYVMLADTVEYGQWKLGTRNESVVFSLRPFIDKMSGAVQAGVISLMLIVSGLADAANKISALENDLSLSSAERVSMGNELIADISDRSTLIMRVFMLIIPLISIVLSYIVYRKKYSLDEERYARIIQELAAREKAQGKGAG